jgi:hypothetical protein
MVVLVVIGGLLGSGNIVKNVAKLIGMSWNIILFN